MVECHAAASLVGWPREASLVVECARAAPVLPVRTGTVAARTGIVLARGTGAIGTAPTGVAAIGAVAIIGVATTGAAVIGTTTGEIRTVDGVGGTATGGVSPGT